MKDNELQHKEMYVNASGNHIPVALVKLFRDADIPTTSISMGGYIIGRVFSIAGQEFKLYILTSPAIVAMKQNTDRLDNWLAYAISDYDVMSRTLGKNKEYLIIENVDGNVSVAQFEAFCSCFIKRFGGILSPYRKPELQASTSDNVKINKRNSPISLRQGWEQALLG